MKPEGTTARIVELSAVEDSREQSVTFYVEENSRWSFGHYRIFTLPELAERDAAIKREALEEAAKMAETCAKLSDHMAIRFVDTLFLKFAADLRALMEVK